MRGRKMLKILGIFLVFMLVCTMLSRASSALTVAVVRTVSPGRMTIAHTVTATGKVQEERELAVSAQAGQKIAQIAVREGDQVGPGDLLLKTDLSALKEQISDKEQELEMARAEIASLEAAEKVKKEKQERAIQRAREDRDWAAVKGDQAVARASEEWDRAIGAYNEVLQNGGGGEGQADALREAADAAGRAYEEAVSAREESLREADRTLEDATVQEPPDPAVQLKKKEAEKIQAQLKKLKKLQKSGGQVRAPIKGVVTRILAAAGEMTAETPLLFLADLRAGCRFTAQVDKSQEEYLQKDTPVTLTNEQKDPTVKDLTIASVRADPEDAALLQVCVYLPGDTLTVGDSAKMTVEKKSKAYDTCVPIQALYEAGGMYFVYVVQEEDTIMGKQLTARKINVTVQEQNETYAALGDGCLAGGQKVIQDADKTIDEGSPVRLAEP